MKRILTIIIHFHWLVFFAFHALGSLAGTLTFAGMVKQGHFVLSFGNQGPMQAFPLLSAGLGTASLLVAVLFFWAFLNSLFGDDSELLDGEVDKMAYGGGVLVFSALTGIALIEANPDMLIASTAYFAALILSWAATRLESLSFLREGKQAKDTTPAVARIMAAAASHPHRLAHVAGRERN